MKIYCDHASKTVLSQISKSSHISRCYWYFLTSFFALFISFNKERDATTSQSIQLVNEIIGR